MQHIQTTEQSEASLSSSSFGGTSSLFAVAAALSLFTAPESFAAEKISVQPEPSQRLFFSPQMGWQTSDRPIKYTNAAPENLSTVSYQKFYWNEFQSAAGRFDLSRIESCAAAAHARGQILDIRPVMPYGPDGDAPAFLRMMGSGTFQALYEDGESRQPFRMVDLNDPPIRAEFIKLIEAIGAKFNKDPRIGFVDLSVFGLWGEGHIGEVQDMSAPRSKTAQREFAKKYALLPETRKLILEAYFRAFPDKEKLAQISEVETLRAAVQMGAGIRMDCFGGYHAEKNVYLQNIKAAGASEVWKSHPVVAEICGRFSNWASNWGEGERQYNQAKLEGIFNRGLETYHLTSINAKNGGAMGIIPSRVMPMLEPFLLHMGYRFEVSTFSHSASIKKDGALDLGIELNNVGAAPCYDSNCVLAFQFRNKEGKAMVTKVGETSLAHRLPGKFQLAERVSLEGVPPGDFDIAVSMVNKNNPKLSPNPIALNNATNGWALISGVRVEP